MMTGFERDDDFEAYLRRRVPIDRRLKSLGRLEPPAELDRLIIGRAREAIQGAPPVRVFRAPRWALPMGLAATILISLSILLDLGMQGAIRKDAGKASAVWVGVMQEPSHAAAEPLTSQATAGVSGGLPAAAMAPAPSPVTPSRSSSAAASAGSSERTRQAPLRMAPSPPLLESVARSAAISKAAPLVAEVANSAPTAADDARSRVGEHALSANRVRRLAEASGGGSAEPLPAAPPPEAHMEIVTVIGTRVHESYAMSVAAPVASMSSSAAIDSAPSYVPDTSNIQIEGGLSWAAERHRHPNPRVWLDHIKKMRAAGLTAAADQELRRFHDAYPDFPAPPDTPSADGRAQ